MAGEVDNVPYRHDLVSGIVVVGSGLVSNNKRDTFKLKSGSTLEAQLRARPKFKDLAAAAVAAAGAEEASGEAVGEAAGKPAGEAASQAPTRPATVAAAPVAEAAKQATAQAAAAESSVLLGGIRRQPAPVHRGGHRTFAPTLLESDLGVAWEPGCGRNAEAEREKASRAAQDEYDRKLGAAIAARKAAKRDREELSRCREGPCLCRPEGALDVLREERREWQTALDSAVKVAKGATSLSRWLSQSSAAPAAE